MHEKNVARSYRKELFVSVGVYTLLLLGSIHYGRPLPEGVLRTVVLLSPIIGFGLMIRALARHVARVDEYVRARLLEAIALAAAITCALSFSYGFLETAGYPKLSMFSVWMTMCGSFGAVVIGRAGLRR